MFQNFLIKVGKWTPKGTSLVEEDGSSNFDNRCTFFYVNSIWTASTPLCDKSTGLSFRVSDEIFSS